MVAVHSNRAAWASEDEPCQQKISMDMWTFMKAEGSAQDADAQHVYVECLRQPEMGLVELITPEVGGNMEPLGETHVSGARESCSPINKPRPHCGERGLVFKCDGLLGRERVKASFFFPLMARVQ